MAVISYSGTGGTLEAKKDPRMNTSPFNNAIVSNYLGYGSYSGADIKIVVHLPRDIRLGREIQYDVSNIKREISSQENLISYYDSVLTGTPAQPNQRFPRGLTQQQAIREKEAANQTIISLTDELSSKEEEYNALNALPTTKVLGEVQTLSWSIHREKYPFRSLGSVYPRTITRGPRTIGGSIVFTVFHKHALHEILDLNLGYYSTGTSDHDRYRDSTSLPDQIPPLDISLVFANEYGALSHMGLWGLEFLQEGGTFSIEDIFSENVVQYMARDLDPIRLVGTRKIDGKGVTSEWNKTASSLLYESENTNRTKKRRNPFV